MKCYVKVQHILQHNNYDDDDDYYYYPPPLPPNHHHAVVTTVALQLEGLELESRLWPYCVEFACFPRACVGFLRALRFPPAIPGRHAC